MRQCLHELIIFKSQNWYKIIFRFWLHTFPLVEILTVVKIEFMFIFWHDVAGGRGSMLLNLLFDSAVVQGFHPSQLSEEGKKGLEFGNAN